MSPRACTVRMMGLSHLVCMFESIIWNTNNTFITWWLFGLKLACILIFSLAFLKCIWLKKIITCCKQSNGYRLVFINATQSPTNEGFDEVDENQTIAIWCLQKVLIAFLLRYIKLIKLTHILAAQLFDVSQRRSWIHDQPQFWAIHPCKAYGRVRELI